MKGRFYMLPMSLVALALVLSLVTIVAPGAGAQDSGVAPGSAAEQVQYDVLAPQDLGAAGFSNGIGVTPKTCCIMIVPSGPIVTSTPLSATGINSSTSAASLPYGGPSRWFCAGSQTMIPPP